MIDFPELAAPAADPAERACGCPDVHCETVNAWCKGCRARGDFHVAVGLTHPIEFWTCASGWHTYERALMTQAEIFHESRKGLA